MILCSCSVLIPAKHCTLTSDSTFHIIESPITKHSAPSCCLCTVSCLPTAHLDSPHKWSSSSLFFCFSSSICVFQFPLVDEACPICTYHRSNSYCQPFEPWRFHSCCESIIHTCRILFKILNSCHTRSRILLHPPITNKTVINGVQRSIFLT